MTNFKNWATLLCLLTIPFLYNACGQDFNSYSGDAFLGSSSSSSDCSTALDPKFCTSQKILQRSCYSCHSNWAALNSTQDYVGAGLLTVGNLQSPILNRLINSGGNMPLAGSALPSNDYNAIVAWVQGP